MRWVVLRRLIGGRVSRSRRPLPGAAGPAAGSRPSLFGALSWFSLSYGFAILGYLAINAVVSRWLGVSEFGYFVIATTVSTGLGQLALLGVHRAGLRDAATTAAGADHDVVLGDLRSAARGAIVVSVPIFSLVSAVVLFAVVERGSVLDRVLLAAVFGVLVFLNALQKLWASYLRGLGAVRLSSLLEGRSGGALVAVTQAGALVLAWWLLGSTGLTGALLATSVGFVVPVVALGLVVQRRWRHLEKGAHVVVALARAVRRTWRFAVSQFASYLGNTVEIWMAGLLLSASDTSLFSSAQRLALLIVIPLTSLQVVFAPLCARLLHRGENDKLERVLRTGATLAALGSMLLWVPMLVAPGAVLSAVFGAPFAAAAVVLLVLSLGNAANVLTGLSSVALTMSRREGVAATIQVTTLVLRIVLGTIAAVVWGLWGLAVCSATLSTLSYLVMWWQARSLLGVSTQATLRPDWRLLRSTRG